MRLALGDGYAEALRKAYANRVAESADLVMYWWEQAAELVQSGQAERLGFITTNSITQIFNRRVLENYLGNSKQPLSLTFAIPNHPWVDNADGAAVRIALTVAQAGNMPGTLATVLREYNGDDGTTEVEFAETEGLINADLSVGAEVATALLLRANADIAFLGVKFYGQGFVLGAAEAEALTATSSATLVKLFVSGQDLTQRPRGLSVVDATGLTAEDLAEQYPQAYQRLLLYVKPERDHNPREAKRKRWWLFGENQPGMRRAVDNLARYIVTTETSKHRFFQFVPGDWVAEGTVVVIGSSDAYHLGILSSRAHLVWALAAGGTLEDRPRYNKTRCFDPFPFPTPTEAQQTEIRKLAEQLDAHRKRQQAQHPTLTLTDLYNVVEKLRAGLPLTAKEQVTHENGLAAVVLELHKQLDAAVADAYGWPVALPDAELLTRLVQLNQQRAAEEAAGTVRYLRPAYQAPEGTGSEQLSMSSGLATETVDVEATTARREWPAGLAQQMRAVREVVEGSSGGALTAAGVAGFFAGKVRAGQVQPLLESLAELALVRVDAEHNTYAA